MPSYEEIQTYLAGAWRLMRGKPDGVRMLDLSADGFWNSFFAIVLALPPMLTGWVTMADSLPAGDDGDGGRMTTVLALAIVDISAWILPLMVLAFAMRPLGVGDRFVAYVVASNWGSALLVWLMLPPALIRLFAPAAANVATLLSFGLFGISLVLGWRLTNAVINRGPGPGSAVFGIAIAVSLFALIFLQSLFGIIPSAGAG